MAATGSAPADVLVPLPTLQQLRAWLALRDESTNGIGDEDLAEILAAERSVQAALCLPVPPAPPGTPEGAVPVALARALYRRVGRHISARSAPLGLTGDAEFGQRALPGYDAEIRRLEAAWRRQVCA